MKPKILSILFILIPIYLLSQNNMEQIAYMEGEHTHSQFGYVMAALDFNGDGYDDLVVSSPGYNNPNFFGKLYFYFGGEEFETEPEFTITGNEDGGRIKHFVTNLGDVNNDGYEDLGYTGETYDVDEDLYTWILLGNTIQDTIPDFEMIVSEDIYDWIEIRPLGDINNDDFDDVGIALQGHIFDPGEFYIIYGCNDTLEADYFTEDGISVPSFNGVGDVNNDGYDDFCIGYMYEYSPIEHYRNQLYFGSNQIEPDNYITLWDTVSTVNCYGMPAGDINGDGIDDFVGHFGAFLYNDVWLGTENITIEFDYQITGSSGGGLFDFGHDYGDVNGDGNSDIVMGTPNFATNDGIAKLYMGGPDPNGDDDMIFDDHGVNHQWGLSVEIGRFNGDEYYDVAIAGPRDDSTGPNPGYVYIFAGNPELEDYVSVDEYSIPKIDDIVFNAYPNPFNPNTIIEYSIPQNSEINLSIYNMKGQRIRTLVHGFTESGNHSVTWDGTDDNGKHVESGIYLYKLETDGMTQVVKKMLLVK